MVINLPPHGSFNWLVKNTNYNWPKKFLKIQKAKNKEKQGQIFHITANKGMILYKSTENVYLNAMSNSYYT